MASYSTITWSDGKKQMPTRIEGANTQAKLETLAAAMKTYSNAVWNGVSVFYKNGTPGTPVVATFQAVTAKAVLTFRSSDNDIVKLSVPAPKASMFNELIGTPIVTTVAGEALATALSTASDKTLTFLQGVFAARPGKRKV